ncbi:pyridoxamine 5'-phosphate oxidase family protein [Providencia rettgeri]|uniref:pyridoxamine 5'-phosphate oxidase family protein n=1 Tax=Providencia rettgeri TaxID=587 RepID=UPI0032DB8B5A
MSNKSLKADLPFDNPGEMELRKKYPSMYQWDEYNIRSMISEYIHAGIARFIEAQQFFFIATANEFGHCDASFRGTELSPESGTFLPACKVINNKVLVFPDYSGNGLYNSLGNILRNPHIGMVFVDFERQSRARINGKATIKDVDKNILSIWPNAQAYIEVTVEQVYGNCPARIPRMKYC